jgi:putative transposase
MGNIRKKHSPEFKFKVALEAASGQYTLSELASKHGVHTTEISRWRKYLHEIGPSFFNKNLQDKATWNKERDYQEMQLLLGKQTIMIEQLKKKLGI